LERLAVIMKALSNETRLEIVSMLIGGGELCECEIVAALGITQSKASRHLRELTIAGLVSTRRRAVWIYFSLPEEMDAEAESLLEALKPFMRAPSPVEASTCCQ
jgi:ArsR family transcriptional regulator